MVQADDDGVRAKFKRAQTQPNDKEGDRQQQGGAKRAVSAHAQEEAHAREQENGFETETICQDACDEGGNQKPEILAEKDIAADAIVKV